MKKFDQVEFFGNGESLHDSITGKSGSFRESLAKLEDGAKPIIAIIRRNALFIDKILSFLAEYLDRDISIPPFIPSPTYNVHDRFNLYIQEVRPLLEGAGIKVEIRDEQLLHIFKKIQDLANDVPETELLRLLGIVCQTSIVGPHWFVFETINACNSDCLYCNIHSPSRLPSKEFLKDRLSFEIFTKIIDDLSKMGVDGITILANGEPLLHPEFSLMAAYGKNNGLMVNFFTNGLLMDEKIAKVLVDAQVDEAFVTISAGSEETYLALHSKQKKGDFYHVINNMTKLQDLKKKTNSDFPKVTGVHVICAANYKETMLMAKQAAQLGFTKLRLALIRLDDHNRRLALTKENILHLQNGLPELENFCAKNGVELWDGYRFQLDHADDPKDWSGNEFVEKGCLVGWGLGLVKANADLSFCCVVKPMANLKTGGSFAEVWHSEFYQKVRTTALKMGEGNQVRFSDNSLLYTPACHHCDNHDINVMLHRRLAETGLDEFMD